MKHIVTQILVTLGVIFLILILIGIYFFVTDPYGLKPLIFGDGFVPTQTKGTAGSGMQDTVGTDASTGTKQPSTGFTLSDAQKQALTSLGIDPAAVPSSISPEQEGCFVKALGAARVSEIKAGAVPNALELIKAKPCI